MEEQQNRVLQCLGACLEPQNQRAAENQLNIEEQHPGHGLILARISLSPAVAPPLKQLAAVILKSFIKRHWVEGDRGFQPPEVGNEEKQEIRNLLPHGLGDPDSKIRTAVGMAIAAIASWDWPQSWPGLMEHLVAAIKNRSNPILGEPQLRSVCLWQNVIRAEHCCARDWLNLGLLCNQGPHFKSQVSSIPEVSTGCFPSSNTLQALHPDRQA